MRLHHGYVLGAILGMAMLAAPLIAQQEKQGQDSVADAARKARAKKKDEPKPAKVLTNDDISKGPEYQGAVQDTTPRQAGGAKQESAQGNAGAGAASKDAQASAGKAATAAADQADAEDKNPEVLWRKRFAAVHKELDRAETELNILQREFEKAQTQYYSDPTKAMIEQNTRKEVNDKQARIDEKRKQIDAIKQKIADMEAEMRRSGGDPGWAR